MKTKHKLPGRSFRLPLLLAFALVVLQVAACSDPLTVHFIDGGDCITEHRESCGVLSEAKVVDYLKARGIQNLDVIVATHAHGDHIGGLPAVISQFGVGVVYDPGKPYASGTYDNYLGAIDEYGVLFEVPTRDDVITLDDVKFTVLHPVDDPSSWSTNNTSIVLRMEYGEVAFIFTGDVEAEGELEITGYYTPQELKSQVLKVAHHGSITSSIDEFLDAVNPEVAVVSVGEGNRHGLPNDEVVDAIEDRGIKLYRTDRDGTVVITSNGKTWDIK